MAVRTESAEAQPQFMERVGNYPVVASTMEQMRTIYIRCKESNNLLKYSLETAESGARMLTNTAAPMVGKLPITTVNQLALSQLQKLETMYPIVTMPTEEVLEEGKKLYDTTLKPSVDKVSAVGQFATDRYEGAKEYSINQYEGAKEYSYNQYEGAKEYGFNQYEGAKEYGFNQYEGAKEYGYNKVQDISKYSTEKASQLRQAGTEKLNTFLVSGAGQAVVHKLDQAISYAEIYVDKYLPEDENESTESTDTKPRTKLYNRTMRELKNLQMRSQETLQNLHFTVDLIEYARSNIDQAKTKLAEKVQVAKETGQYYWEEIQKAEEVVTEENKTLERRAVMVARNLTKHLQDGLAIMKEVSAHGTIVDKAQEAITFTNAFMWSLMKATNVEELPEFAVTKAKEQITHIQETMAKMGDLITSYWPSNAAESLEMQSMNGDKNGTESTNGNPENGNHE